MSSPATEDADNRAAGGRRERSGALASRLDAHHAALAMLFVLEALVFYAQLASRITPLHPLYHDQVAYMVQSYQLIANFQVHGWSALFAPILHPTSATGLTFTVQGALLALLGGPNRTAMLSLNLLYFIALQLVLFGTVRRHLRSVELAWLAVGLLLSISTLFSFAGSLTDYRIDFAAFCTYGIWVCLIIQCDGFRDLGASLMLTAAGVWLILLRFITIVYLGGVFGGLLIALLVSLWLTASRQERDAYARRARNLFISGILTAALAFPVLYSVRGALYAYYGVGHFFGDEKYIRAAENNIHTFSDHIVYYPSTIWHLHLGPLALWLIALAVVMSLAVGLLTGWSAPRRWLEGVRRQWFDLLACALAVIVPLVILTLDYSKSPVVGAIMVVPILMFVLLLCAPLWRHDSVADRQANSSSGKKRSAVVASAACAIIVLAGLAGFLSSSVNESNPLSRLDRERIVALNEAVARQALENYIGSPKVSFDRVVDYLNLGTLELYGYERFRHFINFRPSFGHGEYGIFPTPRDKALELVMDSDIVILTDASSDRTHPYPINTKIKEYWNELWRWANDNLVLVLVSEIVGIPHHVFIKPGATISGMSGEWITGTGLTINVDSDHLLRFPIVALEGRADEHDVAALGATPDPRAVVMDGPEQPGAELPATFKFSGQTYSITINARAAAATNGGRKRIRLKFHRNVVQSRGTDTRDLVLRVPSTWGLRPKPPN